MRDNEPVTCPKTGEEIQEGLIQNTHVWLMILDERGTILEWNRAAEAMSGYAAGEVVGRNTIWKQIYPDQKYRKEITGDIRRIIEKNDYVENLKTTISCRDGSRKVILWNTKALPQARGQVQRYIAIGVDISERVWAEEIVQKSEHHSAILLEAIPDLMLVISRDGTYRDFHVSDPAMLAMPPDKIIGTNLRNSGFTQKTEDLIYQHIEQALNDKTLHQFEYDLEVPQGNRHYEARMVALNDDEVLGIIRDITERKEAEEALRKQRWRLEGIIEGTHVGTWEWNVQTGETVFNEIWAQMIGYTLDELSPVSIRTWEALAHPDDIKHSEESLQRHFTGELPYYDVECRIRHKDGHWIWVHDRGRIVTRTGDGRPLMMFGTHTDITERKQAEEKLRESRQLFSDIISFLPDPTFVIDKDGRVLAWNRALEQVSGVPPGAIVGKGDYEYSLWQYGKRRPILIDLVQNPDQDAARMNYFNIHHEGTSVMAETQVSLPSGKTMVFFLVASPLFNSNNEVIGAIESMRDITHIKETEAELSRFNANLENLVRERTRELEEEIIQRQKAEKNVQEALDYTRSVIEANPDLMVVLDHEGTILDINTTGETLTGLPRDQLIGRSYFGFLEDDGTLHTAFSRLIETRTLENLVRIRRTDGHLTPLSVHATIIPSPGTTQSRIIASAHDITRQMQDEAAIQASLNEKVLLLREIHHRVKNNLQIIISLTNLQMRTVDDPDMKQILAETRNRVRAMSLVHEKLYMSENLSSIDLADYTKFLASQLFSFYGITHSRVALMTEIEKIPLDIDTAIPLGLILNELISNALKHAFPEDRHGTLLVSGRAEGETLTIGVSDDGVGFPPGSDWRETESLGLRLITSLVDQLGGTIDKRDEKGTMFIITIHRKSNKGSNT